ncbi:MAG: hypothetical protein KC731_24640 [Myxococcales bacterium]|nr:hypothetical protein [Myxococcales bacterium]
MARDSEGNVLVIGGYHGDVQVGGEVLTSPGGWDDDNMFLIKLDPNGQPLWSRRFGDEGPMQVGRAVACDGNDDIIIAGGVSGTADFGGGALTASTFLDYDAFVAKLDPQGNHRWSYLVGNGGQMIYTMAAHPDGTIAIAGSSEGRMSWPSGELVSRGPFVAKLDTDGALRWAKGDPDGAGLAAGVAIGASGVVAATGSFSKTLTLGEDPMVCAGRSDVFVVELTP